MKKKTKSHIHLYEVDLMRIIFMLAVVATHVTSHFTYAFINNSHSQNIMIASHMMLHFARFGFMFITGLVMFLVYYKRPKIQLGSFWLKHFKNIGIPYIFWTGFYLIFTSLINQKSLTFTTWIQNLGYRILHPDLFYMYYLFVTMQFYIVFPIMIWIFKKYKNHHNLILGISAAIQFLLLIFVKYFYPNMSHKGWPYLFVHYGDNFLFYQYYFFLGGYIWINYDKVKKWIRQHKNIIYTITVLLALGTVPLYYFNSHVLMMRKHYAVLAHQPYIMIYSTFIILSTISISLKYAELRQKANWQKFSNLVNMTSILSFGIYLTQLVSMLILERTFLWQVNSKIPSWLLLLLVPVGFIFVSIGSWLISYVLYKVPPFGILIGRSNWKKLKAKK